MTSTKKMIEEFLVDSIPAKIADVAKFAKVSPTTVSRVLNNERTLVSKNTFCKVERTIKALGYQPTALGRALRRGHSDLVALFVPDTLNPYYSNITDSIEVCLQQDDVNLVLCNTREEPSKQDAALQLVLSFRVRCIVMLGAVDSPGLRDALKGNVPVLFINCAPPEGTIAPFIGIDHRAAGSDVAKLLHSKGVKRVDVIRGSKFLSSTHLRFGGFQDTMAELGTPIEPGHVWQAELTGQDGYDVASKVLEGDQYPEAVFCANNLIAYGFYRYATQLGLKVPDDLLLVGFDDNPLNRWLAPWLISVSTPYEDFGPVVRALISGNKDDQGGPILLDHKIVEGALSEFGGKP
jgi:LacI family transcriptional regulator